MYKSISLILLLSCILHREEKKCVDYVNPFIGTADADVKLKFLAYNFGGGNTYPGAVTPWGMTAISPRNTIESPNKDDFSASPSGYGYGKEFIYGFSQIHLSGVGCNEWGNILMMPSNGGLQVEIDSTKSKYIDEAAEPGYYKVMLTGSKTLVEVTATTRTTISKFTSEEKTQQFNIVFDLFHAIRAANDGYIKIISADEVEGWNQNGGFCGSKAERKVYFVARFSKPAQKFGTYKNHAIFENMLEQSGAQTGGYLQFAMEKDEVVYVKIGISFVSIANARQNLMVEQPSWDFGKIKEAARMKWNDLLSRIKVEGGTDEQKTIFYTALYHTLIHPSICSDVNGEYIAMGSHRVKKISADRKNQYNVYSLWDTYRNLHQLLTLVYPEMQLDMVKTMVDQAEENGFLPKWELSADETYVMNGDPACSVIADTYVKGLTNFDVEHAYTAMVKSSTQIDNNKVRPGLAQYIKNGYIPEDHPGEWVWGTVATTLEYCVADWSIGQLAASLGKISESEIYKKRSTGYKNFYDRTTGFLRPRNEDGSWYEPFNPDTIKGSISGANFPCGGVGYTEGNAWQYNFFVPHDIKGLIELMGKERYVNRLQACFDKPDRFVLFNEPDMAYPYLFTYVGGESWRTQKLVRRSINQYFAANPGGLPGNDDCGTTSAWLVFSSIGFYPVCPASTQYQIGSPIFNKVTITLNRDFYKGDEFIIKAKNNTEVNLFIQNMKLNGNKYENYSIDHSSIVQGGTLEFEMESIPVKK